MKHRETVSADLVIIGAGVVGSATAALVAERSLSVVVLEKGPRVGEGVSSRNSGVIHAGLYYKEKSLKSYLCLRGKRLLYAWAERHGVPYRRLGKIVLAKNLAEAEVLRKTFESARSQGASGLAWLEGREIQNYEKSLEGVSAIFSSETGIVDPAELTRSLRLHAETQGANFCLNTEVLGVSCEAKRFVVKTAEFEIVAQRVVNAAGLYADQVARMTGITKYRIYPWRGDYFRLQSHHAYEHLIYPVKLPADAGLGVHLTVDLSGQFRLGPDVEYASSLEDFSPRESKLEAFREAASRLLGPVESSQLRYDTCGIRPKLRSPADGDEYDFIVEEDLPGWVNLVGIESPGLTASLAVAELALQKLGLRSHSGHPERYLV